MTYARSQLNDIVPLAEKHNIGLMTNAAHRYSESKEDFLSLYTYNCPHIVDSGGYNIQVNYNKYPWNVKTYHNWLDSYSHEFDWAAIMDYACEKRFDNIHSVDERVNKTIENTIEHFNIDPNYNILPILQGRSIEKYIESYDRLKDHGIPLKDVGLGTICRISSSDKILETEREIRENCKDIEKIHGFGVKINAYKKGAEFESADSQAWVYPSSNGKVYLQNSSGLTTIKMPENSRKRTVWSFVNYYDYVTKLSDNFEESDIDTILCNLDIVGSKSDSKNLSNTHGITKEIKDLIEEYPNLTVEEIKEQKL